MRVVRVREKSPAPDGLRRVCYAYGCVDLTGAGLEPYLMKGGFFWIAFRRVPSQRHLVAGSPLQLFRAAVRENPVSVSPRGIRGNLID